MHECFNIWRCVSTIRLLNYDCGFKKVTECCLPVSMNLMFWVHVLYQLYFAAHLEDQFLISRPLVVRFWIGTHWRHYGKHTVIPSIFYFVEKWVLELCISPVVEAYHCQFYECNSRLAAISFTAIGSSSQALHVLGLDYKHIILEI